MKGLSRLIKRPLWSVLIEWVAASCRRVEHVVLPSLTQVAKRERLAPGPYCATHGTLENLKYVCRNSIARPEHLGCKPLKTAELSQGKGSINLLQEALEAGDLDLC